ncbi:MAG: FkbM family methyltransferase [Casimicrobiaceae bacterium]
MSIRALGQLLGYVWRHPLNGRSGARGRIAALGRVLRWQLGSRLLPGPFALPFVEQTSLLVERGMTGATGNWYCGLHEVHEMAFVLHALRADEFFVDVGANVGSYTVLAAGAAAARVVAVEPVPRTFDRLRRNVAFNRLEGRVNCHPVGLSAQEGVLRFSRDLDTVNHVLADDEKIPAVEVLVATLDALLDGAAPTLLKIDVEGHDLAVLRGARHTLSDRRCLAVIMETNGSGRRYGVSDADLLAVMREAGFEPFGYDAFARRLIPGSAGANTVFVRDPVRLSERLRTARTFRLINGVV